MIVPIFAGLWLSVNSVLELKKKSFNYRGNGFINMLFSALFLGTWQ